MRNPDLARDYVRRASVRLRALDVLHEAESWADVVRESQEVVDLALKGLLRARGVEPPRIHDVSDVLLAERARLPVEVEPHVERLAEISRQLRRDRELAFYGADDLTPSGFYTRSDADGARSSAREVVERVRACVALGLALVVLLASDAEAQREPPVDSLVSHFIESGTLSSAPQGAVPLTAALRDALSVTSQPACSQRVITGTSAD